MWVNRSEWRKFFSVLTNNVLRSTFFELLDIFSPSVSFFKNAIILLERHYIGWGRATDDKVKETDTDVSEVASSPKVVTCHLLLLLVHVFRIALDVCTLQSQVTFSVVVEIYFTAWIDIHSMSLKCIHSIALVFSHHCHSHTISSNEQIDLPWTQNDYSLRTHLFSSKNVIGPLEYLRIHVLAIVVHWEFEYMTKKDSDDSEQTLLHTRFTQKKKKKTWGGVG